MAIITSGDPVAVRTFNVTSRDAVLGVIAIGGDVTITKGGNTLATVTGGEAGDLPVGLYGLGDYVVSPASSADVAFS